MKDECPRRGTFELCPPPRPMLRRVSPLKLRRPIISRVPQKNQASPRRFHLGAAPSISNFYRVRAEKPVSLLIKLPFKAAASFEEEA